MGERTSPGWLAKSTAEAVREHNRRLFDGPFGVVYDAYMQRERWARVIGRVVWGSDVRPYYASMDAVRRVPERMLALARRRARRRGLHQVELARADAQALPLEAESADLFLSYFGLHCFADPEAAVQEAMRCLRPGGRLVGAMIVQGERPLDRLRVRPHRGAFGPVGTSADLERWLDSAGAHDVRLHQSGVFAVFSAVCSGAAGLRRV